jgi:pyridoxamine--pyruvate transaminase
MPVILQGEAVLGLEAAAASLVGPEDVVLALVSGAFGKDLGRLAQRYAKEVIELNVSNRNVVDPTEVRAALLARPDISVVSSVHCETVSGTINPMREIGPVVAEAGAMLLVDAVGSFAGMPVDPQAWCADVIVAGPEKCLGGPPGLSLLYVSEAAWAHMEANPRAPRASFLSVLDWRDTHLAERPFPFTPSVAEVYALEACLEQYLEEGATEVQARHRLVAEATRAGGLALGLSLWPADPSTCSDTVTVFMAPGGVDAQQVLQRARGEWGVMLTGGHGDVAGQVLRIGHMGPSAYPMAPVIALTALGSSLKAAGFDAKIGAGVEAAVAAIRQ